MQAFYSNTSVLHKQTNPYNKNHNPCILFIFNGYFKYFKYSNSFKNYINVDKVYLLTPYLKFMRNPAVCYALTVPNTPKISAQ